MLEITLCSIGAALVAVCVGLAVYSNKLDNEAVVTLVQRGADPVSAMCAIRPSSSVAALCGVAAKK